MNDIQQTPDLTPSSQKGAHLAMACIMAAASLWGCIGLFNRGISAMDIGAPSIVLVRNLGACVLRLQKTCESIWEADPSWN